MAETLNGLREFIAYRVREGFESAHDIVENAREWACGESERDDLLPEIKRLTAEVLAAHRAEQSGWGTTKDCDRLGAAFVALNRRGIVARQAFSCCNNCGFTEIWDEIEEQEKRQPVEGYVFKPVIHRAGHRDGATPDGLWASRGRPQDIAAGR